MKIAFEGPDGVGKSTCAKAVADTLGYEYVEKPLAMFFEHGTKSPEFKHYMKTMYNLDDASIKSWFIGLGNLIVAKSDKNLIIDRHFASNYFWNGTNDSDTVFKTLLGLGGKPDITFLLCASIQTRIYRLKQRNPNDWDLIDPEKQVLMWDKMEEFLKRFRFKTSLER